MSFLQMIGKRCINYYQRHAQNHYSIRTHQIIYVFFSYLLLLACILPSSIVRMLIKNKMFSDYNCFFVLFFFFKTLYFQDPS